jgi:hypothetical protein
MKPEVIVRGIHELETAFANTAVRVDPVLGKALRELAKPVQQQAQSLALGTGNVGPVWSRMRIGRRRLDVFIAEKERGSKVSWRKRPNLFPLLMSHALNPALEQNRAAIQMGAEKVIANLCRETEKEMFPV